MLSEGGVLGKLFAMDCDKKKSLYKGYEGDLWLIFHMALQNP